MFITVLKEWLISSPDTTSKKGDQGPSDRTQWLVGLTHIFQRNIAEKCVMAQNRATLDCWSFSDYVSNDCFFPLKNQCIPSGSLVLVELLFLCVGEINHLVNGSTWNTFFWTYFLKGLIILHYILH